MSKKSKKMPHLYKLISDLIEADSFNTKSEDIKNIEILVGRRFRVSKGDLRICLKELHDDYGKFEFGKKRNKPTLIF